MRALAALLLAAALSVGALPAAAQTHIAQPFKFLWDYADVADRFEFKLDAGSYANVGIPPQIAGSFAIQADPALTGAHSAVVRACLLAVCTADSDPLAFIVDLGPPAALRLAVGNPPPLPFPAESPTGTKVFAVGDAPITDSRGAVWALGPKDPAFAGGLETTVLRSGVVRGTAVFLCYSADHQLAAFSAGTSAQADWYTFSDTANLFQLLSPAVPAGCV